MDELEKRKWFHTKMFNKNFRDLRIKKLGLLSILKNKKLEIRKNIGSMNNVEFELYIFFLKQLGISCVTFLRR